LACKLVRYCYATFYTFRIFLLILMTMERFSSIVWPLKRRISVFGTKLLIITALIVSLLISVPIFLLYTTHDYKEVILSLRYVKELEDVNNRNHSESIDFLKFIVNHFLNKPRCIEVLPTKYEVLYSIYFYFLLSIQCFIPFSIITILYFIIAVKYRKNNLNLNVNSNSNSYSESIQLDTLQIHSPSRNQQENKVTIKNSK
jgi:hypothetical protein